ncbi:Cuticle Protein CPR RR Uncl [Hyalella azteca]|uniref:Cuticle Protein CPR RR Uncl n=1 Tax=Hyalella azteca TaxID=294128 RepID=A0A6A0GV64_HYAAZ|nr:uncharacterized protein LOC108677728 [Hyalella azteca]KAA0189613.1 Cuticle Protein CPR RR Uncl [Hyalella azteca]
MMKLMLLNVAALLTLASGDTTPVWSPQPRVYHDSSEQARPYAFEFEVDAPYHGTWHDRREQSSGSLTEGRFRVALPDHRLQTVTYKAKHGQGFLADVLFEQHPDFPSLRGHIGKAPAIGQSVVPGLKAASPSSGITYPKSLQNSNPEFHHRIPKFDNKIAVGNEFGSKPHSNLKPFSKPVHTDFDPHNHPVKHSASSHTSFSSEPLSAFIAVGKPAEKPHANHFTAPGTSPPRANFVPSRHTLRPVVAKPQSTGQKGRPLTLPTIPNLLQGVRARPRPQPTKPQITRPPKQQQKPPSGSRPALLQEGVPVPHFPNQPPKDSIEPPTTNRESFNLANKDRDRYKIRPEEMNSVRSRLNGIVHH